MQKMTAMAVVLGALIVAVALIYHGRQLASVARNMEALEQRTGELDTRLETFASELPSLIEDAGRGAGRQAVHGVIEEAFQKPFTKAASTLSHTTSNFSAQADNPLDLHGFLPGGGIPLIRFDIPDPVVNIEIRTQVEDLPSLRGLSPEHVSPEVDTDNQPPHPRHVPVSAETDP